MTTNARCPNCHKKLELRGEGDNKSFWCACGYREKMDAFKERSGDRVNKREVGKFLAQHNEKGPINSGLADALKNWKD